MHKSAAEALKALKKRKRKRNGCLGPIILIIVAILLFGFLIDFIFSILFINIIFSSVLICIAGFICYSKLKKVEVTVNPEIDSANKILKRRERENEKVPFKIFYKIKKWKKDNFEKDSNKG